MKSSRWKNASLAINTIIRGLDLDQIAFQYDDDANLEGALRTPGDDRSDMQTDVSASAESYGRGDPDGRQPVLGCEPQVRATAGCMGR